ncbi:N-acetylmuramoyl-L-alanine amidase [Sulfitobacter pontiacus]|uniref:N-acetylmuramoyl-L-alanine amidase n=1 Tax=Sulfitobacter pontiacus TaxID=60137 RepID=UPI0015DE4365|nr:N-acetylmuramoyl-L-alanine amidase [Sulfitobacter pontiacus]QLL42190.1 N-acetylmuramoyl-L-alanine amidase [Sulfitobacter pontiacus]
MADAPDRYLSPNHGPRRNGLRPSLIVLHYTAMDSAEAACARLCDPAAEVSAHYLITGKGETVQLVPEDQRAWHAGAGEWRGQDDINSRSIGIELDNRGNHPFSEPQMVTLETLLRGIMERWSIPPEGVIGHSDMAPGRKIDPGPRFDWPRLARQSLAGKGSRYAEKNRESDPTPAAFIAAAHAAGYTATDDIDLLLHSTRLRYAPWRKGPLCAADMTLGHDL